MIYLIYNTTGTLAWLGGYAFRHFLDTRLNYVMRFNMNMVIDKMTMMIMTMVMVVVN